jgi:type I restriction enzyme S subunit
LKALLFPLPPFEEQQRIVETIDEQLSSTERFEAQVETNGKRASRVRQVILTRAFEGRLVPQDLCDEFAEQPLKEIRLHTQTASHEDRSAYKKVRAFCNEDSHVPVVGHEDAEILALSN